MFSKSTDKTISSHPLKISFVCKYLLWNVFFLASVAQASSNQWVSESCKARPVRDPNVQGRATSVQFPGGYEIKVVGHIHGDRQIFDIEELVSDGRLSQMSDGEFDQYMRSILAENKKEAFESLSKAGLKTKIQKVKEALNFDISTSYDLENAPDFERVTVLSHAEQDLTYLTAEVNRIETSMKPVAFIGYEGSERLLNNNRAFYIKTTDAVRNEYKIRHRRGGLTITANEIEQILLSSMQGNVYPYVNNPALGQKVPLVGTESEFIKKTEGQKSPLEKMTVALNAVRNADSVYTDKLSKEERGNLGKNTYYINYAIKMSILYEDVTLMRVNSLEQFQKRLEQFGAPPPWLVMELKNLYDSMKERIALNNQRDWASAVNLASRKQNGIHFVGFNHFKETIKNLEILCTQQETSRSFPPPPYDDLLSSGAVQ